MIQRKKVYIGESSRFTYGKVYVVYGTIDQYEYVVADDGGGISSFGSNSFFIDEGEFRQLQIDKIL